MNIIIITSYVPATSMHASKTAISCLLLLLLFVCFGGGGGGKLAEMVPILHHLVWCCGMLCYLVMRPQ